MWDPGTYLAFADLRARPFFDLLSRIGAERPRRVVDLGCGPGTLTGELARRWPDADIAAVDSSPEMVADARERGVPAEVVDVRDWQPTADTDVVVCNAVLQWVPDHAELLARWMTALPSGAWFAMQVPGNFDAPSHRLVRELSAEPRWSARLAEVRLRDDNAAGAPADYATILSAGGASVDVWETTYLHELAGPDPVLDWITGTALRPIRAALAESAWQEFRADLAPRLATAYPAQADGRTWFPFRRIFAVALKP